MPPPVIKNNLIIFGNGSVARMLFEFTKKTFNVVAFTVDREFIDSSQFCSRPLVAFDQIETLFDPENHSMIIAIGFIRMNDLREERYQEAKKKGYRFENFIHPTVEIYDSTSLGENNIILDHASIHPFCSVGNTCFISSNSNIGHDCEIGDNCWINAGVSIAGSCQIKESCFFGVNASTKDNITIPSKCYIGANTFVNRTLKEPGSVFISPGGEVHPLKSSDFLKSLKP